MVQIKKNLANRANYGKARKTTDIKYIVIHYTGNDGDTDESNGKYFHNNVVKASAHYFVDSNSITQSVPDNYVAYSVGGKKLNAGGKLHGIATNSNSISIELCDDNKNGAIYPSLATINNALDLVRLLMKKYNVKEDKVIRHYDVTGKSCPAYWCGNSVKDALWQSDFKCKISGAVPVTNEFPYSVKVNTDTLNVRSGASSSSKKVTSIARGSIQLIDKEKNGWGHLANNAGWISLKYTIRI